MGDFHRFQADGPDADAAEGLVPGFVGFDGIPALPVALPDFLVELGNLPEAGQHQRDGMFRHRIGVAPPGQCHCDVFDITGGQVDVFVPNAVPGDDLQVLPGVHHGFGVFLRPGDDGIHIGNGFGQGGLVRCFRAHQFIAFLCQELTGHRFQRLGHQNLVHAYPSYC